MQYHTKIWNNVFKNGPSKIFRRQLLKNLNEKKKKKIEWSISLQMF